MKITFSILLIFSIMIVSHCGKSDKSKIDDKKSAVKTETKTELRYVTAKGGLRMRDKPNTSGAKLGTIPTGTKVDLLEETGKSMTISGSTGKWSKVKWGNKSGWVFGGFLTMNMPVNLVKKIINKTIVFGEGFQNGPPFFIKIMDDNTFVAVCQENVLNRGESRGSLSEKYAGIWSSRSKGGITLLTLLGSYWNVIYKDKKLEHSGKMNKSVLEIKEKNGKLFLGMKNSQNHDSCFSVGTGEVNYALNIKSADYIKELMDSTYFR